MPENTVMIKNPQNEHESWCFPLCPESPDWKLDWQDLVSCFEWVRQMAGVSQDPVYHGEGDLLIHTRMVRYHGLPLYFLEREFNCPGYP